MLRRVNGRHKEFPMSQTSRPPKVIGTATFTLAGIADAFGLAACCALPFLLASVGLGAAWLAGVAVVAAPYRTTLLPIGALCIFDGAVLLTPQQPLEASCGGSSVFNTSRIGNIGMRTGRTKVSHYW